MLDLLDRYYERLEGGFRAWYQAGQVFEAPALFLQEACPMPVLASEYDAGTKTYRFKVEAVDRAGFESFDPKRLPNLAIRLRSDERAAIIKCKMRPVILASAAAESWQDRGRRSDDCFIVVPLYSVQGKDGELRYSQPFIERLRAYMYNTFFYLPPSDAPRMREGFARFDRIQVIHKSWLHHLPIRLTGDARNCFAAWLYCYLAPDFGRAPTDWVDIVLDYREEKLKTLVG